MTPATMRLRPALQRVGRGSVAALSVVILVLAGAGDPVSGQMRSGILPADVSVEFRGGATIPGSELGDGLSAVPVPPAGNGGLSFGGDLMVGVTPRVLVYAGWHRAMFDCEEDSACLADDEMNSDGFGTGLMVRIRSVGTLQPWVRGGAIFHRFEHERGQEETQSDASLGFEAGAGVDVGVSDRISIVPAFRYRRYSADFPSSDNLEVQGDIDWFQLDVGLRIHLFRGGGR